MANDAFDRDDDYFRDTRMSFGDHIEDLRRHLILAILGFMIGVAVGIYPLSFWVLEYIQAPMRNALRGFYDRQEVRLREKYKNEPRFQEALKPRLKELLVPLRTAEAVGWKVPDSKEMITEDGKYLKLPYLFDPDDAYRDVGPLRQFLDRRAELIVLRVEEALMVYIKVALLTGLVISCPWVFHQIWAFVAAGLYPHEKRLVNYYLPVSIILFLIGVVFCFWLILPNAVDALLWFNEWLGVGIEPRLSDWLGFALLLPVITGLSFQTPLVMFFMQRVGFGSIPLYHKYRPYAYFAIFLIMAVVSPTGDAINLLYLSVPMIVCYELGILTCWLFPGQPLLDFDMPDDDEMVEV